MRQNGCAVTGSQRGKTNVGGQISEVVQSGSRELRQLQAIEQPLGLADAHGVTFGPEGGVAEVDLLGVGGALDGEAEVVCGRSAGTCQSLSRWTRNSSAGRGKTGKGSHIAVMRSQVCSSVGHSSQPWSRVRSNDISLPCELAGLVEL